MTETVRNTVAPIRIVNLLTSQLGIAKVHREVETFKILTLAIMPSGKPFESWDKEIVIDMSNNINYCTLSVVRKIETHGYRLLPNDTNIKVLVVKHIKHTIKVPLFKFHLRVLRLAKKLCGGRKIKELTSIKTAAVQI